MYTGDPYIYGQSNDAPDWAKIIYTNNNRRYMKLNEEIVTPHINYYKHYASNSMGIVDRVEYITQAVDEIFGTETEYGLKNRTTGYPTN
jgi:hypothetical protein